MCEGWFLTMKMNKRPCIWFFILLVLVFSHGSLPGFSQGEFNNWYFGMFAGMSFNSGVPVSIPNGYLSSSGVSVSVSDSAGNFLFFTNGFDVYNKNKIVMSNGYTLHGQGSSFYQPVIAVQNITLDNLYYIFTVGRYTSTSASYGLEYSILDMNLNGGLGDIVLGQKNISIQGMSKVKGAVTGTRHWNNRDAWVVTRITDEDSNYFASFKISTSGLNTTPVLGNSQVIPTFTPAPVDPLEIKISQDGTHLVCAYWNSNIIPIEFCQFDRNTGQVSSLFRFFPSVYNGYPCPPSSFEFSPDSKLLYVSTLPGALPSHGLIYQYDATKTDSLSFMQSETIIGIDYRRSAIQMGPDWKIYCTDFYVDSLHVINNPNIRGSGCNFQLNAVSLNGEICTDGLPQFIQRYKAYVHHIGSCPYESIAFTSDIWPPADTINWIFGDPTSGVNNTSALANPLHVYSAPGVYTVELYVRHNDNRTDTTWQIITILPAPQPDLGPDQTICAPQTATFDAGACTGCSYQWDDLTTMTMNIGSGQTYTTGTPGLYRVNVTGPNGCTGRDTVQLSIGTPVAVSVTIATGSTTVCAGTQVTITATGQPAGNSLSYQWKVNGINSGPNNSVFTYTPLNGDCIVCSMTSTDACATGNPATSNQICMTVSQLNPVSVNITSTSTHTCAGTPVIFNAFPTNPGNNPVYLWKVNGVISGTNSQIFTFTPANGDCITCELTSDINCPTGNPALSNTICMTVDQPLPVSVTVTTAVTTVCAGTSVTFTANPTHGGSLPSYQWKVNAVNVSGATNSTYTYVPLNGDIITCQLSSSDNCVTGNPAISSPVTMTITQNPAVTISITPSANPFCPGSQVTFIAVPNHGGLFPVYLWKVNGSNAGTNSSSFTYTPLNGDIVTCELTSSDNCVTGNPATSAPVTMTASPILVVSVSIVASSNPFCAGSQVTFTATPDHGGLVPGYQWKVNGGNAGTNNPTYTYSPANGDQVSCVLNSSASCITGNPALSNIITMTVNTNLPAGVSISTLTNPFCPGTSVTITATPNNGGLSPSYQWKLNGVNAGTNLPTFTFNPAAGDSVRCVMTSNLNCVTGNPASSARIIMSERAAPNVTFTTCFDTVTILGAQPFSLHGGLPLGGQYSGPGVNTGIFTPSVAGTGFKTITYGYANVYTCLATKTKTILVQPNPSFTCGNNLTDIRDNKVYPTVQIGSQCWMASNLDFGFQISDLTPQTDNCLNEKYSHSSFVISNSFYQWDELMRYQTSPGAQGLCPPGWHIPSAAEWNVLLNFYPGAGQAGGYLKDSLLVNGFHSYQQGFLYLNNTWAFTTGPDAGAMYWTSTTSGTDRAVARGLNIFNPSVSMYPSLRENAFPVRCLRD